MIEWLTGLSERNLQTLRAWFERREALGIEVWQMQRAGVGQINDWVARSLLSTLMRQVEPRLLPEAYGMLVADMANVRWSEDELGAIRWAPNHFTLARDLEAALRGDIDNRALVRAINNCYRYPRWTRE
jgi:hypothetical protein